LFGSPLPVNETQELKERNENFKIPA